MASHQLPGQGSEGGGVDGAVSKLIVTHEYHQTVLRLAHEFSGTQVAWNVSQHVLDQLWETTSQEASGDAKDGRRSSNHNHSGAITSIYGCQACGYQLHPGWRGTYLRVKRPNPISSPSAKKTLRRRELRKRKKAAKAEAMKAKDSSYQSRRRQQALSRNNADSNNNTQEPQRLVLLRDHDGIGPLDRNRLVLTCGRCGHQTHLQGLRREPPATNRPAPIPEASSKVKAPSQSLADFERLPRLGGKPKSKSPTAPTTEARGGETVTQKSSSARGMSLLEQKLGRPKKKKKPANAKKSGNLMDFLSSLNDH